MTKYLQYLLALLMFLAAPIQAQRGIMAIPAGAQMDRYPILPAEPMSLREMAARGLHPVALTEPTEVLNHYRNVNRFVLEVLPTGTVVLADSTGIPIYKADCVNRLILPALCPTCIVLDRSVDSTTTAKARQDSINRANGVGLLSGNKTAGGQEGFWSQVGRKNGIIMDWGKSGLSWLLPALFWILVIGLIAAGIWWVYTRNRSNGSGGTAARSRSGSTGSTSAPIAATPATVAPQPAPTPAPIAATPTSELSQPTSAQERTLISFASSDGSRHSRNMLRFSGARDVTYEKVGDVTTIRFDK